jgi:hypothetical protein
MSSVNSLAMRLAVAVLAEHGYRVDIPGVSAEACAPNVLPVPNNEAEPGRADFRWGGRVWALSPAQLGVARALRDAADEGVCEVPEPLLVEAAVESGAAGMKNLRDVFRGSPAWLTLVVMGGKVNTFRLAPRPEDDR